MCWVGGKMTGERTEDDQISLILLTSKAQLRRLAQGASGKDSMTHTHTTVKGNFRLLQLCFRSSACKGMNEGKEENAGARGASKGEDRALMEVD